MDDSDITRYITGVTMDGTEFDFEALCSSLIGMRITRMVVRWLYNILKQEHPDQETFGVQDYSDAFYNHREEVEELIRKRTPTVERDTERFLKTTLGL